MAKGKDAPTQHASEEVQARDDAEDRCATFGRDDREDHAARETIVKAKKEQKSRCSTQQQWIALTSLRLLFLDSSLLIVFGVYCFLMWVEHVHENYLIPQSEAAKWTLDRVTKEMT